MLTLWSVVTPPLQYLAPAEETEGGQAVWYLNGHDLPISCLLNVLHIVRCLSQGNLFTEWATMVASLRNQSDCWVYGEMPLSYSSGVP